MNSSLLASLAALTVLASNVHALSGGPWDNDSADGTQGGGVHSAVMTGPNLTGVVQLNIDPANPTGTPGLFVVFHEGTVASGEAVGIINQPARLVAGTLQSDATTTFNSNFIDEERPSTAGAFLADVYQSYPTYQWEGDGTLQIPSGTEVFQASSVETDTTTQTIVSNGNTTVTTTVTSSDVDAALILPYKPIKFTIRGVRTSTVVLGSGNGTTP